MYHLKDSKTVNQYQVILNLYQQEYKIKEVIYRMLCQNSLPIIIQTASGRSDIHDVEKLNNDEIRKLYHRFPILAELGTDFKIMKYKNLRKVAQEICRNLGVLEYSELIVALL